MEYVAGKSLQTILQLFRKHGRTMPLTMAAFIVSRVCEGLDYVFHKVGLNGQPLRIVHRDVSPHNVLVGYEGTVKLIDFGIAHAKASREDGGHPTTSQKLQGKFDYMSPEQVAGDNVDHRSDVFSVGVCLYELVTNRHPFTGNTEFNTLENIRKLVPAAPSTINADCSTDLDAIIMKSLEKHPSKRWERTGDLMEALQRYIVSKPPLFNATSLSQFMRRTFARDIEDERKKNETYVAVKLDDSADESPTMAGLPDDLIAEMARVARAKAAESMAAPSAPSAFPTPVVPAPLGAPRVPLAKRTLIGMPTGGAAPPPAAPAAPARPVARPIAGPTSPPRPSAPPTPLPAAPPMPGPVAARRTTGSFPPAPAAPPPPRTLRPGAMTAPSAASFDAPARAATLLSVPSQGDGEAKVVAIPTKPGFPAVRSPAAAQELPAPSEGDLDFDDDEAPTAVLDDKLASIVRTLAGAGAQRPGSGPPPLPIDSGGLPGGLQGGGDVYEVERVERHGGATVAEPGARSRRGPWLLVAILALAIIGAGVLAYFFFVRGKLGTGGEDAAIVAMVTDAALPDQASSGDSSAQAQADAEVPPPDAADVDAANEPQPPAEAVAEAAADGAVDAVEETAPDVVRGGAADEVTLVALATDDAGSASEPDTSSVPAADAQALVKPADAEPPVEHDAGRPPPRDAGPPHRDATNPPRDTGPPPPRDAGTSSGGSGKLSVISSPWSWVAIDGRATSRKTPLVNYEVSVGIHRVCLTTEDSREYCTAVRISADQPARVVHNF